MLSKLLYFIQYHNAVTIVFVVLFFGFSVSFAASPEMREAIYSSTETVVSVDNGVLLAADLDAFNFNLKIRSVTEDDENYYALYSYQTLAVADGAWQAKEIEKIMTVGKEALDGRDLGLYLAEELGENISAELAYLKRVRLSEKEKGESQKIVAVEYAGLIGKLLDPSENVIEGYEPVIPEPAPEIPATVAVNPAEVVVSTQYAPAADAPVGETESAVGAAEPQAEFAPEPERDFEQNSENQSPQSQDAVPAEEELSSPAPEAMVNEELVRDVVAELLREQATSTLETEVIAPAPDAPSAPENDSAPEEVLEPVAESAVSEPEAVQEPAQETDPAHEAASEPIQE